MLTRNSDSVNRCNDAQTAAKLNQMCGELLVIISQELSRSVMARTCAQPLDWDEKHTAEPTHLENQQSISDSCFHHTHHPPLLSKSSKGSLTTTRSDDFDLLTPSRETCEDIESSQSALLKQSHLERAKNSLFDAPTDMDTSTNSSVAGSLLGTESERSGRDTHLSDLSSFGSPNRSDSTYTPRSSTSPRPSSMMFDATSEVDSLCLPSPIGSLRKSYAFPQFAKTQESLLRPVPVPSLPSISSSLPSVLTTSQLGDHRTSSAYSAFPRWSAEVPASFLPPVDMLQTSLPSHCSKASAETRFECKVPNHDQIHSYDKASSQQEVPAESTGTPAQKLSLFTQLDPRLTRSAPSAPEVRSTLDQYSELSLGNENLEHSFYTTRAY